MTGLGCSPRALWRSSPIFSKAVIKAVGVGREPRLLGPDDSYEPLWLLNARKVAGRNLDVL